MRWPTGMQQGPESSVAVFRDVVTRLQYSMQQRLRWRGWIAYNPLFLYFDQLSHDGE